MNSLWWDWNCPYPRGSATWGRSAWGRVLFGEDRPIIEEGFHILLLLHIQEQCVNLHPVAVVYNINGDIELPFSGKCLLYANEEMKAQNVYVTYTRSHCWKWKETGLERKVDMTIGINPFCSHACHQPTQTFFWSFELCSYYSMTGTHQERAIGKYLEHTTWKPRQVRKAITWEADHKYFRVSDKKWNGTGKEN